MKSKTYIITKKIAKHGSQAVIIVPALLQSPTLPWNASTGNIRCYRGKMNKKLGVLVILALALIIISLSYIALTGYTTEDKKETIRIGILLL